MWISILKCDLELLIINPVNNLLYFLNCLSALVSAPFICPYSLELPDFATKTPQCCSAGNLFSPVDVQWSPPGLAASRRLFLMLTLHWGAESADDTSEASRAAAGVEERAGTRGVAKNGISFPRAGVRKPDSLSGDLLGPNHKISQYQSEYFPVKKKFDFFCTRADGGMRSETSSR